MFPKHRKFFHLPLLPLMRADIRSFIPFFDYLLDPFHFSSMFICGKIGFLR
jgi:hypothetical protein